MNEFKYVIKNLMIMIGGISSIIFFIFYIYFPIITNHGDTITVPNLIGMELNLLEVQLVLNVIILLLQIIFSMVVFQVENH